MAKINLKKDLSKFERAEDSVKTAEKEAKLNETKAPEYTAAQEKTHQEKNVLVRKEKKKQKPRQAQDPKSISTYSAIKIIFYMMAADGKIYHNEEEKFDAIGAELDPEFAKKKKQIVKDCKDWLDKAVDSADYYKVMEEAVEDALIDSKVTKDSFITPKLLVWDLLTVAYSDEHYDETEQKLLRYIVNKLDVDKSVFLELENSILTLMDLERELQWIKTTDRPYLKVEMIVNEIADRKNVVFESVKDLIVL